jgi:nucleoid DNA-binding protein
MNDREAAARPLTSKSRVVARLADTCGLTRTKVREVLDELARLAGTALTSEAGAFTVPGLVRLRTVARPATKARLARNPRTGMPMHIAARPARRVIKAVPTKAVQNLLD